MPSTEQCRKILVHIEGRTDEPPENEEQVWFEMTQVMIKRVENRKSMKAGLGEGKAGR